MWVMAALTPALAISAMAVSGTPLYVCVRPYMCVLWAFHYQGDMKIISPENVYLMQPHCPILQRCQCVLQEFSCVE